MSVTFTFSRGRLIIPPVRMRHVHTARPDMALDTAARMTVITPGLAQELGFGPDELEPNVGIIGVTGTAKAALVRIASVSVRGLEARNVRALCHPLPRALGLEGILGLNFLRHFDLIISNKAQKVTLTKWDE